MKKNLLAVVLALVVSVFFVNAAYSSDKAIKPDKAAIKQEKNDKKETARLEKEAKKAEINRRRRQKEDLKEFNKNHKDKLKEAKKNETRANKEKSPKKEKAKDDTKVLSNKSLDKDKNVKDNKIKEPQNQTPKIETDNAAEFLSSPKHPPVIGKDESEENIKPAKKAALKPKKELTEEHIIEVSNPQEEVSVPQDKETNPTADEKQEYEKTTQKENSADKPNPVKTVESPPNREIMANEIDASEFLNFSEKQNAKFNILYYQTTSKLTELTEKIKKTEQEILSLKNSNESSGTKLERLKKLEDKRDSLLFERDNFYNSSLSKFNSLLTKKQSIKWEILQQMGYRFFPEFE